MMTDHTHTMFQCDKCGAVLQCDEDLHDTGDGRDLCGQCFDASVDDALPEMSTTKHTPGPWVVGGHHGDDSGTDWREVVGMGDEFAPSYVCQALAENAFPIAASLDLLAALKTALRVLVTVRGVPDKGKGRTDEQQAALDMARAAIAKAEGRT
jgi:hypothetical protein